MSAGVVTITKSYRGRLSERDHGEAMDVLFLGEDDDPLAEQISDDMDEHGRYLSVRYWTSEAGQPDCQMRESAVRALSGDGDGTEFTSHYSEITGYLWTDEEITVGGHDLLGELRSHLGEWCLLEIGYSAEPAAQVG